MKTPKPNQQDSSIELNLTSMIDVIFLLLIFFVCTTDFREPEKRLPTNLGSGAIATDEPRTQEERDLGRIVARLTVAPSGRVEYAIDGKRVASIKEVEALLAELQEIDPNVPVVVDPDYNTPLESVLDVYDCARRVGLAKIKFAASPEALSR